MSDLDRKRAERLMQAAGVEALVLTQPEHVAYAIGANPGVATMWRRGGGAVALVPADPTAPIAAIVGDVNAPFIAAAAPEVELLVHRVWVDTVDLTGIDLTAVSTVAALQAGYARQGPTAKRPATFDLAAVLDLLAGLLQRRGLAHAPLGIDLEFLPAADFAALADRLPQPRWTDGSPVIRRTRAVKSLREIDRLIRASRLAEAGLVALRSEVRPGVSARDLSAVWRAGVAQAIKDGGISDVTGSWDYISVGPDPWGGGGVAAAGSIVKADTGVLVAGYSSDGARTFVLGEPDRHAAAIYSVIEEAHAAGLAAIRPGVPLSEIYAATIAPFRRAGFPGYDRGHFGHSVGAAVGPEEWPFIAADATEVVEPGMMLAFEVPVYAVGIGALMIEDQLLVTDTGIEMVTTLPTGLVSL